MNIDYMQIILETVIAIGLLYLAFFKSYFKEKGKNLATKEDIEDITKVIETVKNQIYLNMQSKLSLRTEERNAIINHYEMYHYWLNTIKDAYIGGISNDNKEKIKEIDSSICDAKFNYELAEGRMELFVDNKALGNLLKIIKIKTIEFQNMTSLKLNELEYQIHKLQITQSSTPIEQQKEMQEEYLGNVRQINTSFNEDKLAKYKEIIPMHKTFQKIVFKHIKDLIEDDQT